MQKLCLFINYRLRSSPKQQLTHGACSRRQHLQPHLISPDPTKTIASRPVPPHRAARFRTRRIRPIVHRLVRLAVASHCRPFTVHPADSVECS